MIATTPQPTIEGSVVLRPWLDDDAGFLAGALADDDIQRWHAFGNIAPIDWITERRGRWALGVGGDWVVEQRGEPVGRVALHDFDPKSGAARIGYWAHPDHRGQGVAPRAVNTLSEWAFGNGLHRIQLEHSTGNAASCVVAVKCGYEFEGIARSSWPHADGWHDMHVHARINPAHAPR